MQELIFLKAVKYFLESPYEELYLRQLAKKLKISPFAAKKYMDIMVREQLVTEDRRANLRYFRANLSNPFFKHLKIAFSINMLLKSGLLDFLKENLANVSAIVLFGSMAKGEDDKQSDVDILIVGKEKYLNLEKFEEIIGRDITLHIFSWSEWNKQAMDNKAFYSDVISYGIALYGEPPLTKWK